MPETTYFPAHAKVNYREGLLGVNDGKQYLDIYYPDSAMPGGGYPVLVWINAIGLVASVRSGSISENLNNYTNAKYEALTRGYAVVDVEVTVPVDGGDPNPGTPVGDGLYNDIPDQDLDGGGNDCMDIDVRWVAQFLWWKADFYGLDMTRSCAAGVSGGGNCAVWAGLQADARDLSNPIPRRRYSSRFAACAPIRASGIYPISCMDSAAGGPDNPFFRKATDLTQVAVDGEDCVQAHLLHASSGWFMLEPGAIGLNRRTPVFMSTDAMPDPDAGVIAPPLLFTVSATTGYPDDVGTPTHGVDAGQHNPAHNIVRCQGLRWLDSWHDTHSILVARGTYTVGGFTPDEIIDSESGIGSRLIDFMDDELPIINGTGEGGEQASSHWFTADQLHATYPTTGDGAATDDPTASQIGLDDEVIVTGLYVDTLAGEFPAVTLVDAIGSELRTLRFAADPAGGDDVFSVQAGVNDFGLSASTLSVGINTVDPAKTWCGLANTRHSGAGRTTPDAVALNNLEVGTGIEFVSVADIVLTRLAAAEDVNHRAAWQVIENSRENGSGNEMEVRFMGAVTIADTAVTLTSTALAEIVDTTKCFIWHSGTINDRAGGGWDSAAVKIVLNGDKTVTFTRGAGTGACFVYYAIVECTGANWIVRSFADTLTETAGTRDAATLSGTIPSWDNAFILGTWQIPSGEVGNEDSGVMFLKPTSGTSTVDQVVTTGADGVGGGPPPAGYHTSGWVIYNPNISVLHDNSLAGGSGTAIDGAGTMAQMVGTDQTKTYTTAAVELASTFLIVNAGVAGTTSVIPKPMINYRLASTTSVELWRGTTATGSGANLAVQIVKTAGAGFATRAYGRSIKLPGDGLRLRGPVGARVNATGTKAKVLYR